MSGVRISYHPPSASAADALPLPELLILRHGETEWNLAGRMQGALDSPLTALGRAQAAAMAATLAGMGVTGVSHRLYASPQGRAMATARTIAAATGQTIHPDERLVEIGMGDWTGLTRAEILARDPGPSDEDWLSLYARTPGGEGFGPLFTRARAFLAHLDGPAVIVTHGVTSRVLRAAALGLGLPGVGSLPGGQGVIHRVAMGSHAEIEADPQP